MKSDLIVVVPGIMGSILKAGETEVWNTSLASVAHDLRRFDEFTRILRLPDGVRDGAPAPGEQGALTAGDPVGGWHVWPGKWVGSGYHDAVKDLRSHYRGHGQVVQFGYDWRLSVRYNGAVLAAFVERELEAWRRHSKNPRARAVLYCHSMGGLIAAFYVNWLGCGDLVDRVITLGTPYLGSVKALRYLAGGDPLVPDSITKTLRTFPSLAQLLPTYRCVRDGQGMNPIGAAGLPDISSQMIQDAVTLREQCAWPRPGTAAAADRPPLHVFGGYRHGTLAGVEVASDALIFHETWLEGDSGAGGPTVERNYRGDGTVPRFAAVPHTWADDSSAIFRPQSHGKLPDHPDIRSLAHDRIEPVEPRGFLAGELEIGLDLPGLAAAGAPVSVHATTSLEDEDPDAPPIRLIAVVTDLWDQQLGAATVLRPDPEGGGYSAALKLPPGTWHIQVSRPGAKPADRSGDVVVVC